MNDQKIWIELIRNDEISSIKKYLIDSKVKKILEIGGNDGFLAKILTDWGFDVTSVDINPSTTYFDVKKMDAINLEFSPNTFDLVFSSHVIAHIKEKKLLFDQINKILKDDGFIIHIVPSNWWSLITNFWHYVLLPKFLCKKIKNTPNSEKFLQNDGNVSNYKKNRLKMLLFFYFEMS